MHHTFLYSRGFYARNTVKWRKNVVLVLREAGKLLELRDETIFLTIDLYDRYSFLTETMTDPRVVVYTCLLLASKFEEIYPPKIRTMAYCFDWLEPDFREQIITCERKMLSALHWGLNTMTPYKILALRNDGSHIRCLEWLYNRYEAPDIVHHTYSAIADEALQNLKGACFE